MMRFLTLSIAALLSWGLQAQNATHESDGKAPEISTVSQKACFPMVAAGNAADIYMDETDFRVVKIAAGMLADDMERVTGVRAEVKTAKNHKDIPAAPAIIAGTLGQSGLIDRLASGLEAGQIAGKWESFMIATTTHPRHRTPLLVVIGSDRRGTAFGLTLLSEAIGVSPWYWWADVTPRHKDELFVEPCRFVQKEPSVQYRGIFINDERFGGWAKWAEQTFDKETGKVGPKTYEKVFELLLRLRANYLWPAMHNGSAAFNSNPENARLADDYAIVMGSSHCEQMLRNNEDEWKNAGTYGDFNYITNRQTMISYWEERVRTNGGYENTYTLGLRGIHDYPMEGARTTQERVNIMQQAIDDQRDILARNIDRPVEDIPQVLCTYEEVLEAYNNGLQVPEDVTLLWSDDKHGYCRNLSNPSEMQRKGGAGIYYHLSYHGDPASWIWLSPLSPAFISAELTKAYEFGARKIWVFNVGDIKPAEKEISFAMELAWDVEAWKPSRAHEYIEHWASKTFGSSFSKEIAEIMDGYYALQAGGKDSHVWFVNYTAEQVEERLSRWKNLASRASLLAERIPAELSNAYFELVEYPVCGAWMLNEFQLVARRSMVRADRLDLAGAAEDGARVTELFDTLNGWTRRYNEEICDGKWRNFFNWRPYHMYWSETLDVPYYTPEYRQMALQKPESCFLSVDEALSTEGVSIFSGTDCEIPIWMEATSPVRNFSKAPENNVFCHIDTETDSFDACATPVNNVWHSPYIGPMWSKVGTLHLKKGDNILKMSDLKPGARVDRIYMGIWPPFDEKPRLRIAAADSDARLDDNVICVDGLGYSDGVMAFPFDSPSYGASPSVAGDLPVSAAPYAEYDIDFCESDTVLEVRTLPTLHVHEGRDARYAVQVGDSEPQVFSIHAGDFTAEWRLNVLRGYSSRKVMLPSKSKGAGKVRIYLLDPGIVLQEILVL